MKTIITNVRAYFGRLRKKWRIWRSLHLFKPYNEENQRKLEALRDIHKGKRCFIVCNGPSLKTADLDKITQYGEISFGSNKIVKIFPKTRWRPTYYTILDERYQYSFDINQEMPSKIQFYRSDSYIHTHKVNHNCVWFNGDGDRALLDNPKFSEDAARVVYSIATVTYAMLELAVYMGMRELYIIGCDHSYGLERTKEGKIVNTGQKSYFEGSDGKDQKLAGNSWEQEIAFNYARKYADAHGIKIYNATRGGKLEAFERVDFDTLFKQ